MTATPATTDSRVEAFERWRTERETTLVEPHGWLSVTGLHWLASGPQQVDGVPGTWSVTDGAVHLEADGPDGLRLDDDVVDGTVELRPVDNAAEVVVTHGDRQVEVLLRGGQGALRVRDPEAPARVGFAGLPRFDWDARWIVDATFEAFDEPRELVVGAVVEGLEHHRSAIGIIRFELGGAAHGLLAYPGHGDGLSVQFRDATSGVTTDASSRVVAIDDPDPDGHVVIDFNRAVNLPCGLIPHATCPLAPPENTLGVAIEAGERAVAGA